MFAIDFAKDMGYDFLKPTKAGAESFIRNKDLWDSNFLKNYEPGGYGQVTGKRGKRTIAEGVSIIGGMALSMKFPGTRISSRLSKGLLDFGAKTPGKGGIPEIKWVPSYTEEAKLGELKGWVGKPVRGGHVSTSKLFPGKIKSSFLKFSGQAPDELLLKGGIEGQSMGWRNAKEWSPFYWSSPEKGTGRLRGFLGYAGIGDSYSSAEKTLNLLPSQPQFYYTQPKFVQYTGKGKDSLATWFRKWMGKSGSIQVDPSNILGTSIEGQLTTPTAYTPLWAKGGLQGSTLKLVKNQGYTFYKQPLTAPSYISWSKRLSNLWGKAPLISSKYHLINLYSTELKPVAGAVAFKAAGKMPVLDVGKYMSNYAPSYGRSASEVAYQLALGSGALKSSSKKATHNLSSFMSSKSKSLLKFNYPSSSYSKSVMSSYISPSKSSIQSSYSSPSRSKGSSPSKSISRSPYSSPYSSPSRGSSPSKSISKSPYPSYYSSPYKSLYQSRYPSRSSYPSPYPSPYPSSSKGSSSYTGGSGTPGSSLLFSSVKRSSKGSRGSGHKVLIRAKGKKTKTGWKKGAWKRLNKKVYSERDAYALGGSNVMREPRRSFKVVRGSGKLSRFLGSWDKSMFRKGKDNSMIEISKHAIDSPSEIRGITMLGLQSLSRGSRGSTRKKRKTKRRAR